MKSYIKSYWSISLIPVALLVAWIGIAHDAREQTVFLERTAEAIEQAQTIPPETEHAIQEALASVRRRAAPANDGLELRQKLAIQRIEAVLSAKDFAQTSGIVSREIHHYVPSE
jgi:hypothetical protein